MEDFKVTVEVLTAELKKIDDALEETESKLDETIAKLLNTEGLREREEKKIRYEIEDLEKEETTLEEKYSEKRKALVVARQKLRSKVLEKNENEDTTTKKAFMSILASSAMYSKRGSALNVHSPGSRRNVEVDSQGRIIGEGMTSDAYSRPNPADADDSELEKWEISPKDLDYDRSKRIGSGAFGEVYRGKLRGKDVAIKKLTFQQFDEETLNEFKKEVLVMVKLRHPNVLLFMGACTSPGNLAMVSEIMPRGSVYALLHDDKIKLAFQTRMLFAKDAALGMNWLHTSNPLILHLDLKTQNLLVDDNWNVKVADFGLSKLKQTNKTRGKAGSPLYMAPEMLLDMEYDEKADVYSFGIVLWELLTQQEPYQGQFKTFEEMVEAVTKKGKRPDIPDDCPPKLRQLIQQCWNPSPANRPSFQQILKSNAFDDIIIDTLISEPNQLARELWKQTWMEKSQVPWQDFLSVFATKLGFPIPKDPEDIQMQCLKSLIVKKTKDDKEVVSLEDFGKMLEWFGPLEKGNGILKRVENELRMKGFWGGIETTEAEKLLNGKKKGNYLVRFSTRDPGCYALTVLSKQGVLKHYRVTHKAGSKYVLGTSEYKSLDELIKTHKKDLYLKTPLPGSKYEIMFIANDKKLATQGYMDQDFTGKK